MVSSLPSSDEIAKSLRKWGFPTRHIQNLDKMTGEGLSCARDKSGKILAGDAIIVLCGARGPGKTQIATFWAAELLKLEKKARGSRYYKAHDLLCLIRQQFDDDRNLKGSAREVLTRSKKISLLVIDEWSELSGTEWEMRTMTNIIDHRYDNLLPTVIITNHAPREAIEAIGKSIWSRAEETGGIVVCDWKSYRTNS